jgi:hypothetical protein
MLVYGRELLKYLVKERTWGILINAPSLSSEADLGRLAGIRASESASSGLLFFVPLADMGTRVQDRLVVNGKGQHEGALRKKKKEGKKGRKKNRQLFF